MEQEHPVAPRRDAWQVEGHLQHEAGDAGDPQQREQHPVRRRGARHGLVGGPVAVEDQDADAVDERQAGQRPEQSNGVPDGDRCPGLLEADDVEAIVEGGGGQEAEEAPDRERVHQPAAAEPGHSGARLIRVAVGAELDLAEGLAPDRGPGRPAGPGERLPAAEDIGPTDTLTAPDSARHGGDACQAGHDHDDHHHDPGVVDQLGRDELEDRKGLAALRTVRAVHEGGEEHGQEHGQDRGQDGPRVHRSRDSRPVVGGDRVAPGGGHELGRVGLGGARLGALAAPVAGPQLLAGQKGVPRPELGVADDPARKRRVGLGQWAAGRAGAAREAGADTPGAVSLQFRVQPEVEGCRRWGGDGRRHGGHQEVLPVGSYWK